MRISPGSGSVSRLLGAVAVLWLGAGSAWAGGGSGDVGSLQTLLSTLCSILSMTSCPQLTPITELVLENAALAVTPPEVVRAMNAFAPTAAINAVNPPAGSPFVLSQVTPLAFKPGSGGTVSVTQLGDVNANSFFYAATDGVPAAELGSVGTAPTTLYVVFDYPPLTNPTPIIARGNDLADVTIPLTVLNSDGTESSVPTLLRIRGASGSPGYTVSASGNFPIVGNKTVMASDLGLTVALNFQSSANSAAKHAVIEVQVPLLLTTSTDPAYFSPALSLAREPIFVQSESGNIPSFLNLPVGMAPVATQFTASIASTSGGGVSVPAVNAFLAIATDGETLVSTPLP